MRVSLIKSFIPALLLTASVVGVTPQSNERSAPPGVQYSYVSQRNLTPKELARFKDVGGLSIAVRMRLTTATAWYIEYLAGSTGSVIPSGYHAFRKVGDTKWLYTSPSRGRECAPGCEFTGDGYRWLELPPGGSVEFEAHDWTSTEQEHAFSAFIKTDSSAKPVEIMSDIFRPVGKSSNNSGTRAAEKQ